MSALHERTIPRKHGIDLDVIMAACTDAVQATLRPFQPFPKVSGQPSEPSKRPKTLAEPSDRATVIFDAIEA